MSRTKSGLRSRFLSLLHNEGDLRVHFSTSQKNAWCKYCIKHAIQGQLGDAEDMAGYDVALGATSNHFRRQRRCMRDVPKPIRGVSDVMAKHIRDCEHPPDSVNLSTIPAATGTLPSQS